MLEQIKKIYGAIDQYVADHIGKPVRVHPDAFICGKYKYSQLLGEGGFGAVFLDRKNFDIVIKTELAMRSEEQFRNEVELQAEASKGGFTCPIIASALETLPKKIYGREPQ